LTWEGSDVKSRWKQFWVVLIAVFPAVLCGAAEPQRASVAPESSTLEQWDLCEITLTAAQVPAHPFRDVQVSVEFVHIDTGEKLTVPGFFDGDGIAKTLSWRALTKAGVRKVHWVITASGSFGTTCLVGCGEFMSGWDVDQLQQRGTLAQLGILARTLRSLPFGAMSPANDLVSPLDTVIDGEHWRSTFALAKPGEAYLVYALDGGQGTMQLAPGTYKAMQLNPRDGSTHTLGEVRGGTVSFMLPSRTPKDHNLEDETDWVLLYQR